jgi:hypothetical protein
VGRRQTPERDSSPYKSVCRRKLGVRLRRSAVRKGSAFPGLGYSSDSLVCGEAAPRRVRRSLTPNDKGDWGATERQSLSAQQSGGAARHPPAVSPCVENARAARGTSCLVSLNGLVLLV